MGRGAWFLGLVVAGAVVESAAAQTVTLPRRPKSVRFAVIGDMGTGDRAATEVAAQVFRFYKPFPFTFVLLLGDNIYGSERPQDFERKFERPYQPLLDAGVQFRAALGNHDDQNQRFYKPFGMGGERYYTFTEGNVRFFVLDSDYLDPDQVKWLEKELAGAKAGDWKIAYFHHPLYTTARRGPSVELRKILEPIFVKHGVNVVFTGHEHIYERLKPQGGIYYWVTGGAAKLRRGDTRPGALTEKTYDADQTFMLVEIVGNALYFQTISRTGETVDKGAIQRQQSITRPRQTRPAPKPAARSPTKPPGTD
jgi:hypothetical protein